MVGRVRLRPLTEAECYARCYGGRREETVNLLHDVPAEQPLSHEPPELIERSDAVEGREAA
jgi:hypothetical protein